MKGQLTLQGALSGEAMTVELMRGASTVAATGTISSGGITTGVITGTIAASALADGYNVWMRVRKTGGTYSYVSSTNTYLYYQ
ncbi:hypothetical protein [Rhodococcus sp. JVH1]|uniref:hypothetical protein n=1 Tax=Rhodococcus sp. JVH1 TaxID=745408 RepID=UPI0002720E41|nr:hypothetical protein JVH1_7402 [Rhodococcus sp. JVH1]